MSEIIEQEKQSAPRANDITDVVVQSWDDMQRMAKAFAASSIVPQHLQGKFTDVLVILQTAKELNIPPMQAINGINVIKGKPSISPELQLALIRGKCPEAYVKIDMDHAKRIATCTMAPSRDRMEESFTSMWDDERVKAMGLSGNDNYKKQDMTMKKWRAIGEASRTVFSHIIRGLYNSEEAYDLMAGPSTTGPKLKEIFQAKAEVVKEESEATDVVEVETSGLEIEQ
jgi:hypothetical protein